MFDFTPDDLNSNRSGFVSPQQAAWIKSFAAGTRRSAGTGVWVGLGFLLFGMCLILALYLQNEDTRAAFFSDPNNPVILAGVAFVVVLVIALGLFLTRRSADRLEAAEVRVVEGPVSFDSEYSARSAITSYFVVVGGERFAFGDDMSSAFDEGVVYQVYYCKSGPYKFIFSFERKSG